MKIEKIIKFEDLEIDETEYREELENLEEELSGCGILCGGDNGDN